MQAFAKLFENLDNTTATNQKVAALVDYFTSAPRRDAVWALYFLTGRRLKRLISSGLLREWAADMLGIEPWLLEESYEAVGDLGETIALLTDSLGEKINSEDIALSTWIETRILPLRQMMPEEQKAAVQSWWRSLDVTQTFLLNKILTGAFRVGVSETLVVRALSKISDLPTTTIAHRIIGDWEPTEDFLGRVLDAATDEHHGPRPYPFFLASQLDREAVTLGDAAEWQAEWKWDGIRCQLVKRGDEVHLWSRGEELITPVFPDLADAAEKFDEQFVIDGELLVMEEGKPRPFAALQRRLGRKKPGAKILADYPVGFMAYDLLEVDGVDLRDRPLQERRESLVQKIAAWGPPFYISPTIEFPTLTSLDAYRDRAREEGVEGLMLKRLASPYQVGRKRGDWWKWKVEPYTVDAVLLYAQAGHGRRANLYTDYTFAVWDGDQLVPFAKAYSGLTDTEIAELDRWIRTHTKERFGPVRSVEAFHVFELGFEGIALSTRHKSGIAVRFPRILRWRRDKKITDADTLSIVKGLLNAAPV